MTVQEGPGGSGTRIINRKYPVTSGLTAGTTKTEGRQINLVAEEADLTKEEENKGL